MVLGPVRSWWCGNSKLELDFIPYHSTVHLRYAFAHAYVPSPIPRLAWSRASPLSSAPRCIRTVLGGFRIVPEVGRPTLWYGVP